MFDFPCTLRDIGGTERLVHLYAEYRGARYYLASDPTFYGAESIAKGYRAKYPGVSLYLSDRNDSTVINGAWLEFENALK